MCVSTPRFTPPSTPHTHQVDVFTLGADADPVDIAKQGLKKAKDEGYTTVRTSLGCLL